MPIMVERNKWILYKHTSSYDLIKAVALDVKNSCKTDIEVLRASAGIIGLLLSSNQYIAIKL